MSTKLKKKNYVNIKKHFSNATGVSFSKKDYCKLYATTRVAIICVCIAAACVGVFATDEGQNIIEKLFFNRPVESENISYGFKKLSESTAGETDLPSDDNSKADIGSESNNAAVSEVEKNTSAVPGIENESSAANKLNDETNPINNNPEVNKPDHLGIDIVAEKGTPVYPVLAGVVSETGWDGERGNYIVLTHQDEYTSTYAHLASILVENGQEVDINTQIGTVGNTGMSTGPHLHLEMKHNEEAFDPTEILYPGYQKFIAPNDDI